MVSLIKNESIFTFKASNSSLISDILDIWRGTKRMVMQAAVYQESALVLGLKWLVRQIRSKCFCKKSCRFATKHCWQSGGCVWLTSDETGMRRRDGLLNSHGKSRKCRTVEDLIDYPEKHHELIPNLLWKLDWFLVCAVSFKNICELSILNFIHNHLFSFQISSLV